MAPNSLVKGLTTSCGCNYKGNGNYRYNFTKAQERMSEKGNYTLLEYSGMNHPCLIQHEDCGKTTEYEKYYNFIHSVGCECIDNTKIRRDEIYKERGYTFVKEEGRYNHIVECDTCLSSRSFASPNYITECPCKTGRENENQCAVYLLSSDIGILKIGVSYDPPNRLFTFYRDTGNPLNLKIEHVWWFYNNKSAYHIESLLHRELAKYREKQYPPFDGSTEYFNCSLEDVYKVSEKYKLTFELMKAEEPEKEPKYCKLFLYDGRCWRSKREAIKFAGLSLSVGMEKINRGIPLTKLSTTVYVNYGEEELSYQDLYSRLRPNVSYKNFTCVLRRLPEGFPLKKYLDNYTFRNIAFLYKGERTEFKDVLKDQHYPKWKYDKHKNKEDLLLSFGAIPYWSNIPIEDCYV